MSSEADRETKRRWAFVGGVFFLVEALLGSSATFQLTQLDYSRSTFLPWLVLSVTLFLYLLSALFFRRAWKLGHETSHENQQPPN